MLFNSSSFLFTSPNSPPAILFKVPNNSLKLSKKLSASVRNCSHLFCLHS
ncbi:MAG: hypothetical protein MRERV_61c011 [Mycoplasmataceae bacterium RV_VA103A]|nr:MAG: hypothetical protein MRERV_61c011 [Mycoplasmataceae bacterium RV_VA103A]